MLCSQVYMKSWGAFAGEKKIVKHPHWTAIGKRKRLFWSTCLLEGCRFGENIHWLQDLGEALAIPSCLEHVAMCRWVSWEKGWLGASNFQDLTIWFILVDFARYYHGWILFLIFMVVNITNFKKKKQGLNQKRKLGIVTK